MKVNVKRGNKVEKTITTGMYADQAKSIPSKPIAVHTVKSSIKEEKPEVVEEKIEEPVIEEKEVEQVVEDSGKRTKDGHEVICPIEFDESLIKKPEAVKLNFGDTLESLLKDIEKTIENEESYDKDLIKDLFDSYLGKYIVDEDEAVETEDVDIFEDFTKKIDSKEYSLSYMVDNIYYDKEYERIILDVVPIILSDGEVVFKNKEILSMAFESGEFVESMRDAGWNITDNDNSAKEYNSYGLYASKVMNIKDIFQNESSRKVIAILDGDGNYLTKGDDVIFIDAIDDRSVNALSVVSKQWLDSTLDKLNEYENSEDNEEVEVDPTPTGVFPPVMTVNGVSVKEDIESEEN